MNSRIAGLIAAAMLLLAAGVLLGRYGWPQRDAVDAGSAPAAATAPAEREVLYWYDPMVPDQRFDKPGKSPFMDMMLVPRYADEAAAAGVRIDPAIRQNLGIRTAPVERGALQRTLVVPGTLQWDLRAEQRVSARVDGIVDRLLVSTPYQRVRAGEPLATLIAPEWAAALAEYRALAGSESVDAQALLGAARARLRALGLSPADIAAADADDVPTVTVRSPIDGVLGEIEVRAGQRVMAGETLFRINGTAQIWMNAEIPQAQADLGLVGEAASVRVSALPGETFAGTVEALLPDLDPATRTQSARIVLDDPDARLAAGMFAEARLQPDAGQPLPLVPIDAVLVGGDVSRVIVAVGADRFVPVEVELGRRAGGMVEVLSGLDGSERIVVSGQFLIDSEASMSGLLRRLEPDAGGDDEHGMHGHDMEGHDMEGHDMQGHDMEGHDRPGRAPQGHDMEGHDMESHDMEGHDQHGMRGHEHAAAAARTDPAGWPAVDRLLPGTSAAEADRTHTRAAGAART